jgi:hypothetical protein
MASPASISPLLVLWMAASMALRALSCVSDSTTGSMPPLATTMFALPASALLVVILTLPGGVRFDAGVDAFCGGVVVLFFWLSSHVFMVLKNCGER